MCCMCYMCFIMCYMCFIIYIKTDDIYKDFAEYVETGFDASNYELYGPLPKGKIKKQLD